MATDANLSTIGDFYLGSDISETLITNGQDQDISGVKMFNDGIEIGENNESIGHMCLAVGNNHIVGQYNFFYKGIKFNEEDNYALIYLCEEQPRFPLPMAKMDTWKEKRIKLNSTFYDCEVLTGDSGLQKLFSKSVISNIMYCNMENAMRDDYNQLCIWYGEDYYENPNNLTAGFVRSYECAFTPEDGFEKYNLEQTIGKQITIVNGDKIRGLRCATVMDVLNHSVLSVEFVEKSEEYYLSAGIIPSEQELRNQKVYITATGIKFSNFEYDDASLVFIDQPELSGPANTSTYSSLNVGEFNQVTRRCSFASGKENRTESDFDVALGRKATVKDYCSFVWAPAEYTTSPKSYTFTIGIRDALSAAILPENRGRTMYIGDGENNYMELHKFIVACISSDENLLCALFAGMEKARERKTVITYMDGHFQEFVAPEVFTSSYIEDIEGMASVKFGNSVKKLNTYSLSGGHNLSSAYFPDTVNVLNIGSFYECSNLISVDIPNLSSCGASAFRRCYNLRRAIIPNVVKLESYAFRDCSSLTELYIPNAQKIDMCSFEKCFALSSVNVQGLTSIGKSSFTQAYSLTGISIPLVQVLNGSTFNKCYKLSSVNVENVTKLTEKDFYQCSSMTEINLPNVKDIGLSSFYQCRNLSSVSMPVVEKIGNRAFYNCNSLKELTIPETVRDGTVQTQAGIGEDAFIQCSQLTSLTFEGKSLDEVQRMFNYPWGITNPSIIKTTES